MCLYDEIFSYQPQCEQEEKDKMSILKALEVFGPHLLERDCTLCHMTASAWIVNPNQDQVLMVYHKIYRSWSWTGGHADGEEKLLHVALREAEEETGLHDIHVISRQIAALDVLPVAAHWKNGCFISPHLHLNAAYLFTAEEEKNLPGNSAENEGVRWLPVENLEHWCTEKHMLPVYRKCIRRVEKGKLSD